MAKSRILLYIYIYIYIYKANNSRLVNGEIWMCNIKNQNNLKHIQRCLIANFHNFSIDIIHCKIFTNINPRLLFKNDFSSFPFGENPVLNMTRLLSANRFMSFVISKRSHGHCRSSCSYQAHLSPITISNIVYTRITVFDCCISRMELLFVTKISG